MAQNDKLDPTWAWQPYQPSDKMPWNLERAGHLYRRASFGANFGELQTAVNDGPKKTIDRLLQGGEQAKQDAFEKDSQYLAKAISEANNADQLSAWWLYRMLKTQHPLREKLTLFWHDHFATSNAKINNAGFMIQQYQLLYQFAQGNFAELLKQMSYDPAMIIWLDIKDSRKGAPNENYARELMELFSLGIGHYTEKDIREAARAFTGYVIENNKATFKANRYDGTEKSVLGKKGKFKPDDIVALCLAQEASPYFIVGKLFRFLISETVKPTPELIRPLALSFRKSGFDFGALVETMLRSNLFFSEDAYRSSVKSPVEFAMGLLRGLECDNIQTTALSNALEQLGQRVFYPPSVAGWDSGAAWLNGQTLLYRQNLALALTSTQDSRFLGRCDPANIPDQYNKKTDEELVDFFLSLFLQGDVPQESRQKLLDYQTTARKRPVPAFWSKQDAQNNRIRTLCHLTLTLPEFQLN